MAIQLGSAYGKVIIDSSGVKAGVQTAKGQMQELAITAEKMGDAMKQAGRTLTIGLTLPILALGGAATKAASDFEETRNKSRVVFEDMADSIEENANRAAEAVAMSKTEYLDYASAIGGALKAGGMSVAESAKIAEQAVKHFADLASFHNARVEDVATAWQSAIRGQYEPIQKYFPFITDQYMKTYGIANGLVDANTTTLTANQRAIILNAIALNEQLNPALNDFAETSGGLANQTRIMQAELKNALIMLGENLLPLALAATKGLNSLLEAFNKMPPFMQKGVIALMAFLALLGPLLSFAGTVISIIGTLQGLGISLGSIGAIITGTMVPGFVGLAGSILAVAWPILLIIATLAALYWAFKTNFMGITTTAQQLWFILKYYFGEGWTWLLNSARDALNRLVQAFKGINWRDVGKFIIMGVLNGFLLGIPALIAAAVKAGKAVYDAFQKASGSTATTASGVGSQMASMNAQRTMGANAVARMVSRAAVTNNSRNNSTTINLAAGLTLRSAKKLLSDNRNEMFDDLAAVFG